MKSTISCLVV